jgi:hypothetical protein
MMRNWQTLFVLTPLILSLSAPFAAAQNTDKFKGDPVEERLEKKLMEMQETLLKTLTKLGDTISPELAALRKENQLLKDRLTDSVNKLQAQIDTLQTDLEQIKKGTGQVRIAKALPTTGKLLLVNEYPEDLVFYVNQRGYTVKAGTSAQINDVPAGPFTYVLWSPRFSTTAPTTSMMDPNQTLTLRAYEGRASNWRP